MKIPNGDQFGNVVAAPEQGIRVDPNAYGAGIGAAISQAGRIGMDSAQADISLMRREAYQLQREQEQLQRQQAAEARRVKALTATAEVQNGLSALHDEISQGLDQGSIDKTTVTQTWQDRSSKLVTEALDKVDPENRDLVNATLLNDVGRFQRSIGSLVVKRDQKDILAGANGYLEQMQRYAARGTTEADEAIKNVRDFWTTTAPMAGVDAATAAKQIQSFAENVRYRQASNLVNADPAAALKALKNHDYLPEIDPDKRAALIHTADAAVLRGQQRAAIQAEAAAREQAKVWDSIQTVFQAGKTLTPEYAATISKKLKGSPYEEPLKLMMAEAPQNAAFAAQPIQAQRNGLIALQNKMNSGGATPEEIKLYKKLDDAHKATLSDIKEDPYKAASERGVLTELKPLTLDLASLPQQLASRSSAAGVVSQWVGQEVSLFRPQEAEKVATILQSLPPKDRAGALSGLAKAMTPGQMIQFSKQLGSKDQTLSAAALLAANNSRTSSGRLVSELILTGADAVKEQRLKMPSGMDATSARAEIDKLTRGAYISEEAQRAAGDASLAVLQGLIAEGGSRDIAQAVRLATGGIMELNGQKFVKPYGWKDSQVTDALRSFDAQKISQLTGGKPVYVGGKQVPLEDVAKYMPGATLGSTQVPGRYSVSIGGRFLSTEDGRPLTIPLGGN